MLKMAGSAICYSIKDCIQLAVKICVKYYYSSELHKWRTAVHSQTIEVLQAGLISVFPFFFLIRINIVKYYGLLLIKKNIYQKSFVFTLEI